MDKQDMQRLMRILGKCEIPKNRRIDPTCIDISNVRWLARNIWIRNSHVEDLDWAVRKLVNLAKQLDVGE